VSHEEIEHCLIRELVAGNTDEAQEIVQTHSIDLMRLKDESDRHRVSAIVFQRLAALETTEPLRSVVVSAGRNAVLSALANSARIRTEIRCLSKLFGGAGIEFMVMKGHAIDRNPLRSMNDLDVLIRQRDLERATSMLEAEGYVYEGSAVLSDRERECRQLQLTWNNQFQFRSPHTALSVEVHVNLFERDRVRLERLDRLLDAVDLFWDRRMYDDELGCWIPAREASLALLCVHSATKRSPAHNTYILRHAYDIVHLLNEGIDEQRFLSLCRTWQLQYFAVVSLRLTASALRTSTPMACATQLEPDLSRAARRLVRVHLACFRGLGRASTFHRLRYTLLMPFAIGGGIAKSLRWYARFLFPPIWHQEEQFGVRRTSPIFVLTYICGPLVRSYTALAESIRHSHRTGSSR
jgi:hypothetical protein